MEPINLNHSRYLSSLRPGGIADPSPAPHASNKREASEEVALSPAAVKLYESELATPRFGSLAEQSASKTKQVNAWITLEELESGVRKPFADEESARLSRLSLLELMHESNQLPNMDEHGHLRSSFAGTEQGDRLANAIADIVLTSQYTYDKASKSVSQSLQEFKDYVEAELGIDPDAYSIQFKSGKITVVTAGGNGLENDDTRKVQALLDDPKPKRQAKQLVKDITDYNESAAALINNRLLMQTVSGAKNRYLPKEMSVNQIMEGMNYSNTESSPHLYSKWVGIVAQANEKYHVALEDGSHLEHAYKDTPGLLALTKLRAANSGQL